MNLDEILSWDSSSHVWQCYTVHVWSSPLPHNSPRMSSRFDLKSVVIRSSMACRPTKIFTCYLFCTSSSSISMLVLSLPMDSFACLLIFAYIQASHHFSASRFESIPLFECAKLSRYSHCPPISGCFAPKLASSCDIALSLIPLCRGIQRNLANRFLTRLFSILCKSLSTAVLSEHIYALLHTLTHIACWVTASLSVS